MNVTNITLRKPSYLVYGSNKQAQQTKVSESRRVFPLELCVTTNGRTEAAEVLGKPVELVK